MLVKALSIALHSLWKCFLCIIVSCVFYEIFPEDKIKVLIFAVKNTGKKCILGFVFYFTLFFFFFNNEEEQ